MKSRNRVLRRGLALLTAIITAAGSLSAVSAANPQPEESELFGGTVTLWRWTRQTSVPAASGDDERQPALLLWQAGSSGRTGTDTGHLYAACGEKDEVLTTADITSYDGLQEDASVIRGTDLTEDCWIDPEADSFCTLDDRDCWYLEGTGSGAALFTRDGIRLFGTAGSAETTELELTFDRSGEVRLSVEGEYLLGYDGAYLFASVDESGTTADSFSLYLGEEVEVPCLTDGTVVREGQVLTLEGDTILPDGCTLRVEPGAVLSIDGTFYNNGTILNYGTVLLEEGACVMSLDPQSAEAGSIFCCGNSTAAKSLTRTGEGDLLLLEDSRLILTEGHGRLALTGGASLSNDGTVFSPDSILFLDSALYNRENGSVLVGFGLRGSMEQLVSGEVQEAGTSNALISGMRDEGRGSYLIFRGSCAFLNRGGVRWGSQGGTTLKAN